MLTFIHFDTINAIWGDGTALAYNDATRRPNISFNWAVDGSGNLQNANSAGTNISYISDGFPTARPVRAVLDKGNTTYLDLATLNGGYTANSIGTKASVVGGFLKIDQKKLFTGFGWLNQTPRKADGSYATTDGLPYDGSNADDANAVYYEIILISKNINQPYDFIGLGANIVTVDTEPGAFFTLGGGIVIDEVTGGITTTTIDDSTVIGFSVGHRNGGDGSIPLKSFLMTNLTDPKIHDNFLGTGYKITGISKTEYDANDLYSLEFNTSLGIGLVNRTKGNIYSQDSSSYFGSIGSKRIMPIIPYYSTQGTYTIDNLGLVGFDDIIS